MRSRSRAEARRLDAQVGSVTAEFAVALPAVLLVLACCLSGMQIVGQQLRLQDAASVTARAVARGGTSEIAGSIAPGARMITFAVGALDCVRLDESSTAALTVLLPMTLSATSCAPGSGH